MALIGPDEATQALAWPALDTDEVEGWLLRFSEGVTRRANSVLPLAAPSDLSTATDEVEHRYRSRGLTPTFMISASTQPDDLAGVLVERGYREVSPSLVLAAETAAVGAAGDLVHEPALRVGPDPAGFSLTVKEQPDEAWLRSWWQLDGPTSFEQARVAGRIMAGAPSRYLSVGDEERTLGVARATVVGDSLSLACLAVAPGARRRGIGSALVRAAAAIAPGTASTWLQVLTSNAGARALYSRLGFHEVGRYAYLVAP